MITSRLLRVRGLASGNALAIRVYTVKGRDPRAPTAYIQSSMHGSEVQGNAVIAALLEHFRAEPPAGDVTLVPNANPYAVDQKVAEFTNGRFDPTTGANWNRAYWLPTAPLDCTLAWPELKQCARASMLRQLRARLAGNLPAAQRLALTLESLAMRADCVLDLHCANVSARHVYAPAFAVAAARHLGIPLILSIPNAFDGALDEAVSCAWWNLRERLEAAAYPALPSFAELPQGFTLELGDQEAISRKGGATDAAGVLDFLRLKGVVRGRVRRPGPAFVCELENYRVLYSDHAGHADYLAPLGKPVRKGTPLVQTLRFGTTPGWEPTLAEQRCIPILRHSSAIVHEGAELMKVFTRFRRL
jgi:hypothetical protein